MLLHSKFPDDVATKLCFNRISEPRLPASDTALGQHLGPGKLTKYSLLGMGKPGVKLYQLGLGNKAILLDFLKSSSSYKGLCFSGNRKADQYTTE